MNSLKSYRPGKTLIMQMLLVVTLFVSASSQLAAQAVSQIITDYNGWWKSAAGSINPVQPDNHHLLLAFTYSGITYSTGVNDAALTSHGETFTPGQYQALPMQNFSGTPSGNTKIGFGAMADGVHNGAGPAPSRNLGPYLNDGQNGLDIGTCIANLPAGSMFMSVSNIQASKIGDGIPDIVVTQIADPSTNYDAYEFTDINGNRVGNALNIVLTNITPVGVWVADFYEATGGTILQPGFTQTTRNIRLWAADFSVFGLNASNIGNIAYFKINLSGDSDIAFVAYNTTTVTVQQVLDMNVLPARLRPAQSEVIVPELKLSPNPARGSVTMRHPQAVDGDLILIHTISGYPVSQRRCQAGSDRTRVELGMMAAGIYQVSFVSRERKLSLKLVVQ